MADFEKDLLKFLAGKHPEYLTPIEYDLVIKPSICKMKSASLPRVCDDEPAMLKRNLTIIVGAVLLDKENKVLLIQEAKKKCRGLWYLPAGRLEENETIEVRKPGVVSRAIETLLFKVFLICLLYGIVPGKE